MYSEEEKYIKSIKGHSGNTEKTYFKTTEPQGFRRQQIYRGSLRNRGKSVVWEKIFKK